jgi:hypothetical protein
VMRGGAARLSAAAPRTGCWRRQAEPRQQGASLGLLPISQEVTLLGNQARPRRLLLGRDHLQGGARATIHDVTMAWADVPKKMMALFHCLSPGGVN